MDDKVKKALEEIKHTLATIGYDDVDEHYKVSCALDSFRDGNFALLITAAERAERLAGALRSIAKNTCCDRCQEAALVAQNVLKEWEKV